MTHDFNEEGLDGLDDQELMAQHEEEMFVHRVASELAGYIAHGGCLKAVNNILADDGLQLIVKKAK